MVRWASPKCPARPTRPERAALAALERAGVAPATLPDLGHGSTVATNAVLERKGAAVAFIATRGFRDLLFMQRHDRRNIYDLFYAKPAPPVPPPKMASRRPNGSRDGSSRRRSMRRR